MSDGIPRLRCEPRALERIPREVAEKHVVAPLAIDGGTMLVAIADAGAVIAAEDELKHLTGHPIDFVPASREAILDALRRGYSRMKPKARAIRAPDLGAMESAIRAFLGAAGLDTADPELAETPARVAEAWAEDWLDGYRVDPRAVLGALHPAKSKGMVVVKHVDFHSTCPHHLVPYHGIAHIAYLPGPGVAGFGKLVKLLDGFAHRLILQEQIGEEVTAALMKHLGARGAACVLDAEQACVTTRGPRRRRVRTITRSFRGALERDVRLQAEFLGACGFAPLDGTARRRAAQRRAPRRRSRR